MSLIDEILSRLNVEDILSMFPTLQLKKHGAHYSGACPTGHSSKGSTAFSVSANEPVFNCFSCQVRGNLIHLVELMISGQCSNGKGWTGTFDDAVKHCCEYYHIERKTYEKKGGVVNDYVREIMELAHAHYVGGLKDNPEIVKWLWEKYGFTEEFLFKEGIGYGATDPYEHLSDLYSETQLLRSGLFFKKEGYAPRHMFQGRVVFPFYTQGSATYFAGRSTRNTPLFGGKEAPKYFKQFASGHAIGNTQVSELIQNTLATYRGSTDYVILAEGTPDFLALKMHDISTMSATSLTLKESDEAKLCRFAEKFKAIYVCTDTDANGAGQQGSDKFCELLLAQGFDAYAIHLPAGPDGKMDVAEYLKLYGKSELVKMLGEAKTYMSRLIAALPQDMDKVAAVKVSKELTDKMVNLPPEIREAYVNESLAKRFKFKADTVRQIKKSSAQTTEPDQAKVKGDIFGGHKRFQLISPAQDYIDGQFYYTVTTPNVYVDEDGASHVTNDIYVVSSERNIYRVNDGQIVRPNLGFRRKITGDFRMDGWSFAGAPYSAEEFIKNKDLSVDAGELFSEIRSVLLLYIHFKDDAIADQLTLFIMFSYIYMVDMTTPYIHLWAEKRSGKTQCLELLAALGFNAKMSSSISDAAMYRIIENYRPLLLIDEAENLNPTKSQRDNNPSEKLELLKSGYKKGGTALRCEGTSNIPTEFSNYCPKVFASISQLDSTLDDRTIVHEFKRERSTVKIQEWDRRSTEEMFQVLRNKLYVFGLTKHKDYIAANDSLSQDANDLVKYGITHRAKEIWASTIAMAKLVDATAPHKFQLREKMMKLACDSIKTKEHFGRDSKSLVTIEQFYVWLKTVRGGRFAPDDTYTREEINQDFLQWFKNEQDDHEAFGWLNYSKFKDMLRRYHVIDKDSETVLRPYGTTTTRAAIIITRPKLLEALQIYKHECADEVREDFDDNNKMAMVAEQIEEVMD